MNDFVWSVRVRATGKHEATVHARDHAFGVGPQISFAKSDTHPTALEYLLGALAADVVNGFQRAAADHRVEIDDLEFSATCRLNNPLVHVGVIGETGQPGIETISGTLYVSAASQAETIEQLWAETLARSPLVTTLRCAVELSLRISLV